LARTETQGELRLAALLVAAYSLVSIAYLVIPIADRWGNVLLGTSLFQADSVLTAGILEWGFRSLFSPALHVFNWTAGFPLDNSLALTENLIGWQLFYAPIRALGASVAWTYNTLLVVSLVISGVGAALFARRFGASEIGAAVAGFVFGFGPFHLSHLIHIQTMGVCWMPFALYFLDRFLERQSILSAAGLCVSSVLTAYFSMYFGVFLVIVIPVYSALCWAFQRHRFSTRAVTGLLAAGVVTALAVAPIVLPYVRFGAEHGRYPHTVKSIADLSMEVAAPIHNPAFQMMWSWSPMTRELGWGNTWTPAFPGIVAIVLAVIAVVGARRERVARSTIAVLASLAIISYLLALGPILKAGAPNPAGIQSWFPMPGRLWLLIPAIRWPMRFFFFAWLAGAVIAGLGVTQLKLFLTPSRARLISVLASFAIVIEYWPAPWLAANSYHLGDPMAVSETYPMLASEKDRGAVVELPTRNVAGDPVKMLTLYSYGSAGHLRRVVAIHGSFVPPVLDTLRRAIDQLPADSARQKLANHGVSRLVIHKTLIAHASRAAVVQEFERAGYAKLFEGPESAVFDLRKQ
jgi:hypothetical protein